MKNNLHIVYHFRVRGKGAEGVHISGIVNGFRSLGCVIRLVSPTGIDPTDINKQVIDDRASRESSFTAILHIFADHLPQPLFEIMEILYNLFAMPKLLMAILYEKADLIYERHAFFNFSGALLAKWLRIPLIVEVNEISGYERVRGQTFIRLAKILEKFVFQRASLIITVSDFLNQEVSRVSGDKDKIVTIPNGVPRLWLNKRPSEEEIELLRKRLYLDGKRIVCFIGGLVQWHNFGLLLNSFKSLQNVIPEVVLLIVGDGPLNEEIRKMAGALQIKEESIVLTGNVPHYEVPIYICLADVAIIPETNSYRSPIKMFEYMSMARPLVAPRMPAIEAVVCNDRDGLLFEPGDSDDCYNALLKILTNPDYAEHMGKMAYEKISRKYTWENHAFDILSLVNEIKNKDQEH